MEESMNQSIEAEPTAAQEERQPIVFVANPKAQWHWYSLSAPISSFICLGAIIGVAIYMLADTNRWTQLSGILLLVFGIPGLGSYTIDAIQAQDFAVVRAMVFGRSMRTTTRRQRPSRRWFREA